MKVTSNALRDYPPLVSKRFGVWGAMKRNSIYYLFLLPTVIYFVVIRYFPVYFLQIAFREYHLVAGLRNSEWQGLRYFQEVFSSRDFLLALRNTLIISFQKILFGFPAPLILALLLNEIRGRRFKKTVQTVIYLPHFISWVIIGGLIMKIFALQGGVVNPILRFLGMEAQAFLVDQRYFRSILVVSDIWKEAGWGTILYLAAIGNISIEQYESATIDGANRFQRLIYITLPGIMYVVVILMILRIGNLLNVGFEQIMVLYPQNVSIMREKGLVLEWYIWFYGLQNYRFSFATAAGLFNTLVAFTLVAGSDFVAKRLGQRGIF